MREQTNRLCIPFCLLIQVFPLLKHCLFPTRKLGPNCCGQSKGKLETLTLSRDIQQPYELQSEVQQKCDEVLALSMPSLTSEEMEPPTKLTKA